MKASRFSEEQIIGMIKEQEAGMPTAAVCRKHGISSATFYKYKAKYGGMDVSEARRLKALESLPSGLTRGTRTPGSRSCWPRRCSITPCSRISAQKKW